MIFFIARLQLIKSDARYLKIHEKMWLLD